MSIKICHECSEDIKKVMREQNIRIKDLADKLGITRDTAGRVINGKQEMSKKFMNGLCSLLDPQAHKILARYDYIIEYSEDMMHWNKQQSRFLPIIQILTETWKIGVTEEVEYENSKFYINYGKHENWHLIENGELGLIKSAETFFYDEEGESVVYGFDFVTKKVRDAISTGAEVTHIIKLTFPNGLVKEMTYSEWLMYLQTLVNNMYRSAIFDTIAVDIETTVGNNIQRAIEGKKDLSWF